MKKYDSELYQRYLKGDETAFDEIIKEYRYPLTLFINSYIHDEASAEDLAIDTFMYLLVHKYRFNFQVSLKSYLYMIARSKALDYLKHQKIYTMIEYNDEYIENVEHVSLIDLVLKEERKKILYKSIQKLSQDKKEAIYLVYIEECSYEEAAKIMKKNKKQIDNLLYQAKKELKRMLEKEVIFDENK